MGSSDSTVLYVKQKLFEMLNMPMSLASSSHTTLLMPPSTTALQNCCTLADCGVRNNLCQITKRQRPLMHSCHLCFWRMKKTKNQCCPSSLQLRRQTLTPTSKCGL